MKTTPAIALLCGLCFVVAPAACRQSSEPTAPAAARSQPPESYPPAAPAAPLPAVIARYDLVQIGNDSLPLTYGGGGLTWEITGGHYVLFADNTYSWGYDRDGISDPIPRASYVRVDASTIKFYLPGGSYPLSQFYQERDGLFSTGKLDGDLLTVTYEDFVDFEVEKYALSPGN